MVCVGGVVLAKTGERRWKTDNLEVGRPHDSNFWGKHSKHTPKVHLLENRIKNTTRLTSSPTTALPSPLGPQGTRRQSSRLGSRDGGVESDPSSETPPSNQGQLCTLGRPPTERNLTQHRDGPARRPTPGVPPRPRRQDAC